MADKICDWWFSHYPQYKYFIISKIKLTIINYCLRTHKLRLVQKVTITFKVLVIFIHLSYKYEIDIQPTKTVF